MLSKLVAFGICSIIFITWIVAYILLSVAISMLTDGDIGGAVFGAVAAIGLWAIGLWIFRKMKKPNHHRRYMLFCFLAFTVFLLALIFLAIGEVAIFVVSLVVALVCLLLGLKFLKITKAQSPAQSTSNQSNPIVQEESGGASNIVDQGYQYIQRLKQLRLSIQDEQVVNRVSRLETIGQQIIEFVETHPGHTGKLNKFMDYYFPTALKFLENYASFSQKPVKGENVQETLEKIAQGLISIEKAFEQLLDNLYEDKVMDMDSELALLQQTMAIEGLRVEDPF